MFVYLFHANSANNENSYAQYLLLNSGKAITQFSQSFSDYDLNLSEV